MSRPVVAVTRRVFAEGLAPLAGRAEVRTNDADVLFDADGLAQHAADAQVLLTTADTRVDDALLARLPALKLIANIAVGYNNIDVDAAARRGILVSNTPDVLTESTADMAWALLMAAGRRVGESERWLRDGKWDSWAFDMWLGADYHGTTIGIIGMGRIGRAIARRAHGFGMNVIYHNRQPLPVGEHGARWVTREELLQTSDHVVLVVPYSAESHHLIGAPELALMKPTAVLVNIGRGGVVDDAALAAALESGKLAAAGLDVFEGEPVVNPALLAQPRAVLTPHIGSATHRTRGAMLALAVSNAVDWLDGKPPRSQVGGPVAAADGNVPLRG